MVGVRGLEEHQIQALGRAVTEVETRTAAELVVVITREADPYRHMALLWPSLAALLAPLPVLLLAPATPALAVWALQLAVVVLGLALMLVPHIRLALVPSGTKKMRARRLAREQFLSRGLNRTVDGTGVLLFVSLGERYAEILADHGIDGRVAAGTWDACLKQLLDAARAGHLGDGLVAAVREIGAVLERHAPVGPGDRNELPDRLVIL